VIVKERVDLSEAVTAPSPVFFRIGAVKVIRRAGFILQLLGVILAAVLINWTSLGQLK